MTLPYTNRLSRIISLILSIIILSKSSSFTPSTSSVSPDNAKSTNSQYRFVLTKTQTFSQDFGIKILYPSQFTLTNPHECFVSINSIQVQSAICSLSSNYIIFSSIDNTQTVDTIQIRFNSSTARYSGPHNIVLYLVDTSTGLTIADQTYYVTISIVNAEMTCSLSTSSTKTGQATNFTVNYTPTVEIQKNSIVQIQLNPWGPFSKSNFLTTNSTKVCNGMCTITLPSSNSNLYELIKYSSLYLTAASNESMSLLLQQAKNPPSTKTVNYQILVSTVITQFQTKQYMTCSGEFSVSEIKTFSGLNFETTNKMIQQNNIITLYLSLANPISSISYLRIDPSILSLSYQFFQYNNVPAKPSKVTTTDGTILLNSLTTSATSSPTLIILNNFTLTNPPYSQKPVTLTFRTENLVDSVYYGIQQGTIQIISTSGTITQANLQISNLDINAIADYTIQFQNINVLISTSFIRLFFPSEVSLSLSGSCTLAGIGSSCSIKTESQLQVDINSIIPKQTKLVITISKVTNPSTTTSTSSIGIITYYEDQQSIVDRLDSGLVITAEQVPLAGVSLIPNSYKVGTFTSYTLTVQISNKLPSSFQVKINLPTQSYKTNNLILQALSVKKPQQSTPQSYQLCSVTTGNPLEIILSNQCFKQSLPALSQIIIVIGNITNPYSTKPTSSWQVQTYYNSKLMEYLRTGITVAMTETAQLVSFQITPSVNTVNSQNIYTFVVDFLYPHKSGSRIIIQFPDGIILGSGYICSSLIAQTDIQCFQSGSQLQVTFTNLDSSSYNHLQFSVSKLTNNWYSGTQTLLIRTTTDDITYYYVENGETNVNFIASQLPVTAANNQKIILLQQSQIQLSLSPPFSLTRITDTSLLKIIIICPNQIEIIENTCSLSYSSAICELSSQTFTITNFDNFPSEFKLTFNATLSYFQQTNPFQIKLQYNSINIATNVQTKVQRYCQVPCQQCTASNKSQCLSCLPEPHTGDNILLPFNSTCVDNCPQTFYYEEDAGYCSSCNSTACKNCQTTPNTCTSCQTNKFLFQNKCQSQCPQQYYQSNGQCLKCKTPCKTCSDSTFCLSCIDTYFLDIDNKCVLVCSQSQYIGINGYCLKCTSNCLTCEGSLSNCTSCDSPTYLLSSNSCVRACDPGYYNNADSNCQLCISPCSTCKTASICQSCVSGYYLYDQTTCTQLCPPGTLPKINVCEPCSQQCATCQQTITNCTSCPSPLLYYLNQCLQECPPLTYPYQKICTTCITPCVTCSQSPEVCLSCIQGLYLLNNSCLTSCPSNQYYTDENSMECFACLQNCLKCESTVSCQSCSANYFLFDGVCVQQCPDSKPIVQNRQCLSCSQQCSKCEGTPTNCTQCTVFYFKYQYTCVEECPITFYSNIVTYECEDGLSTKIVFFPILITSLIVFAIVIISKIISRQTSVTTTLASLLSPLELIIWIYLIVLLGAPIKEPDVDYILPIIVICVALVCFFISNFVFFKLNNMRVQNDEYCLQWATNSVNFYVMKIISFVSLLFGSKFYRLVYSRFLNTLSLSAAFKARSNVFTMATIFSVIILCFAELPVIIGCWSLIYSKTLKDQIFYTSIQCLIITVIAALFALIDIYKSNQYFQETQFMKTKKYIQKVKDSSFNKLDEGFDIANQQASVDAERYVGMTGGKFMFTKKDPDSLKDLYFEDSNNQIQNGSQSQQTDFMEGQSSERKNVKKSHMINIFEPIREEEGQYYEQLKYQEEEEMTQLELNKKKQKIKTFQSDQQNDVNGQQQRKAQMGTDQPFDDKKSLISERSRKKRWNNIMSKRKELANKIFNRHPINLQKIEDDEKEDYENEMEEMGGQETIQKRRRRKKKKGQHNKQLQGIYLQRLTQKKKKAVKDVFFSDKSLKYDF